MSRSLTLALLLGMLASVASAEAPSARQSSERRIPAGKFVPFYGGKRDAPMAVRAFYLDIHPVTNAEFLAFVEKEPRYRRDQIARLFADPEYLSHWQGTLTLGNAGGDEPVVFVSWFAARAYCESLRKRLPTESEWEYVARADAKRRDAHADPAFVEALLAWYGRPNAALRPVARGVANVYGVYDLHGLVWEWIDDFNASLVSADDRARDDDQLNRVCGGAASGSSDPADYAAFMRYAFRSSLKASYAVHNLGFRCARSAGVSP